MLPFRFEPWTYKLRKASNRPLGCCCSHASHNHKKLTSKKELVPTYLGSTATLSLIESGSTWLTLSLPNSLAHNSLQILSFKTYPLSLSLSLKYPCSLPQNNQFCVNPHLSLTNSLIQTKPLYFATHKLSYKLSLSLPLFVPHTLFIFSLSPSFCLIHFLSLSLFCLSLSFISVTFSIKRKTEKFAKKRKMINTKN